MNENLGKGIQPSKKTLQSPNKDQILGIMGKLKFLGTPLSEKIARTKVAASWKKTRKDPHYRNERKEKFKLKALSDTDSLTGLKNRGYLFGNNEQDPNSHGELRRLFLEARRSRDCLSVIILDGDFFKNVNDTFGHQRGDEVLREMANIIKLTARESDIVAKYGGEEFIVILQDADLEAAENLANRIKENVFKANLPNTILTNQTISAGVACYAPLKKNNIINEKILIGNADKALYKAKQEGRNKVVIFNND